MTRFLRMFESLGNPDYRLLWLGNLFSFFPFQMSQVARGYLAYDIGGAASAIAFVALGWGLPQLVLAPVGGLLADRFPKKLVMSVSQLVLGVCALGTGLLVNFGAVELWHLFVLGMIQGAMFTINLPARQTFFATVVRPEQIANAVALNNLASNMTRIVGPSLAGGIMAIAVLGLPAVFYLAAAFNLAAFLMLQLVRANGDPVETGRKREPAWTAMWAGFGYIVRTPLMFTLMGLAFVPLVLSSAYIQFMPIFAVDVYGVDAGGLGVMFTFSGIGAIAGSLLAAALGRTKRKSLLQLASGAAFGLSIAVFAVMPQFAPGLVMLVVLGATSSVFMAMNSALILMASPKALYGRIMAVYGITFAMMPVIQVPVALVADVVGIQAALVAVGVVILVFVAGITLFNPAYRRAARALEEREEEPAGPPGGGGRPVPVAASAS